MISNNVSLNPMSSQQNQLEKAIAQAKSMSSSAVSQMGSANSSTVSPTTSGDTTSFSAAALALAKGLQASEGE